MLCFPNCKLNLGLQILGKREDGFHNLETVFYPLGIHDALEILLGNKDDRISFTQSGLAVEGDVENNICFKAFHLLKKDFPQLGGIRMHLHKAIPMGAGLGGGSADGAFALQLLNDIFGLGLNSSQLSGYALQLGSDCPFFIINKPCFASGRGELLEPLELDLSSYKIAVINPGIHVNTGWAFSQLHKEGLPGAGAGNNTRQAVQQPISNWKNTLTNDFEKPVFETYPLIKSIKDALYESGAVYAAMSGSGSTVFGIFEQPPAFPQFKDKNWYIRIV
ncbi:MAG: 4-(cytidine 5'-diphospho)-2-C-methyl-D-erythritol kinase [Ferruginibacter sp.]